MATAPDNSRSVQLEEEMEAPPGLVVVVGGVMVKPES